MRVGLTGGVGSGKSTVAGLLAGHGAVVVDADAIAREVVAPGTPGLAAVAERFGSSVLLADGTLDRAALASVVFSDGTALADLNAITHPRVAERVAELLADTDPDAVVVYDVPLLVENELAGDFDTVVVVVAPEPVRLSRLVGRGMPEDDARARMRTQASDDARRAVADVIVDNAGTFGELRARVDDVWRDLLGRAEAV